MTEMRDVDHTHPRTDETFGAAFRRGPTVAADGGARDGATDEGASDETAASESATDGTAAEETPTGPGDATMAEVDHTSTTGVDRTFERGTEGRSDTV